MSAAPTPADDRPLLVTSALPYANGPLHFGHVAGAYLPADLYVRYQRLRGTDVVYICGTDEHGVAITVNAEKEGLPYAEYVGRWYREIKGLFDRFQIGFDYFGGTSRDPDHAQLSQEFFLRLLRAGAIRPHTTQQHYCTSCNRFLPDRYVEGTCYVCGAEGARGDECKRCGSWLEAIKLQQPRCATCGNPPEVRDTLQYELNLSLLHTALDAGAAHFDPAAWAAAGVRADGGELAKFDTFRRWYTRAFAGGALKSNVRATVVDKLVGEGLLPRAITRDLRWGVPVPERDLDGGVLDHEGKVLYVWFDAPIGYVSASMNWARTVAGDEDAWKRFWITSADNDYGAAGADVGGRDVSDTSGPQPGDATRFPGPRLLHFIGKDNIPFHCIVFPGMLGWQAEARPGESFLGPGPGQRWVLPENVPANEFYNLEGGKFSTSDKRTLDNDRMFELFGVDALRWYLTVSMPETADSQFQFEGLKNAVNAGLADTLGNYASRVLKFVKGRLDGAVPEPEAGFQHAVPAGTQGAAAAGDGRAAADAGATPEAAAVLVTTVPATRELCQAFFSMAGDPDSPSLAQRFERYEFRRATDALLALARTGNQWFDAHQPWKTRKLEDPTSCRTALWCHVQILSALAVGMWPFVPAASDRLRAMLGLEPLSELMAARTDDRQRMTAGGTRPSLWCFQELPAGHALGEPGILFGKIDDETIEQEREALQARS